MKAHLICSEVPLIEGQPYECLCGEKIEHSQFVFWHDVSMEIPVSATNTCSKCFKAQWPNRYLYGVIEAQEALTAEVA